MKPQLLQIGCLIPKLTSGPVIKHHHKSHMEGAGEDSVGEEVDEGACNKNPVTPPFPPPVQKVGDVSEIFEVPPTCQNQKKQIMSVEIPTTTIEGSTEDFIRINMPPTPSQTPKRVNFSPRHSPILYRFNDSPSPLSRGKSSIKNLLPKLSFKFRNTNSELEKAAILALGGSPVGSQQKPIQRTMSLTKLFAPKMKRTSSLPVTPIEHSNPESMHGGNTINYYAKSGTKLPIHRSRSVPELNKDGSIRQIDSSSGVIRVVPTTPRVADGNLAALTIAPTIDAGSKALQAVYCCLTLNFSQNHQRPLRLCLYFGWRDWQREMKDILS